MIEMQEAFEIMSLHLLKQNEKSLSADGTSCRYRGESKMCCALGRLIKDEFYHESLEGNNIFNDDVLKALENSGVNTSNKHFLNEMQYTHDCLRPYEWLTKLREVGKEFDLDTTFLEGV
jgi:hypothetical protein